MSNNIRTKIPGGIYFFTVVTFDRMNFLTTQLARSTLRTAWKEVQARHPFDVEAICLLPDHLHCIWQMPEEDDNFSLRWQAIKSISTKSYLAAGGIDGWRNASRTRTGEAAIWQRRYWEHLICSEQDYTRHFDYIHYNPVKHGYVHRPHDWKWSSFHRCFRKGFYSYDWGAAEPESIIDRCTFGEWEVG
jgi:putative transposase